MLGNRSPQGACLGFLSLCFQLLSLASILSNLGWCLGVGVLGLKGHLAQYMWLRGPEGEHVVTKVVSGSVVTTARDPQK